MKHKTDVAQKLTQLLWLPKEISQCEDQIRSLDAMQGCSDTDSNIIEERLTIIRARKANCERLQVELERYISNIDDSLTRQIFVYRYAQGLNWVQIASKLGGGNTWESVKKRCQRYITKHSEEINL